MNKEQMIEIAKAGFPRHHDIDYDDIEYMVLSGIHRLYEKDTPFHLLLPVETLLSIAISPNNCIQINPGNKTFNHYAAVKKIEELKLVR